MDKYVQKVKLETPKRTLKQSKLPYIKSSNDGVDEVGLACGEENQQNSHFWDSICSLGSVHDNCVLGHDEMFPDGTCCIHLDKVHGKENTKPRVGWTHKTNNK